jgi:opacity protein-like surface antigen
MKMFKKIATMAIAAMIAAPAASSAMDMTGKYGLGYFNSNTPVGGRYWINSNFGVDLGFGFESLDQGDDTYTNFHVGAGFPYILADTDRANFFLRPGIAIGSLDARPYGIASESKWTMISISVMPVAEVFFGNHFSLQAGHGLEIEMLSYPDEPEFGVLAGESRTNIRTLDGSVTYLGFHFYFK